MFTRPLLVLAAWLLAGHPGTAEAQAPSPGSLLVTVRDATDLPVAGATLTVVAANAANGANGSIAEPLQVTTGADGRVLLGRLAPGVYTITIASPGFNVAEIAGLSIRSGARVERNVRLEIAGFAEQVDVAPDAADREILDAFTTQMTPEEIDALPEDPEELALVLQQLVGEDAEIRVDGFAGELPAGVRIEDIRIRWDGGSAGSGGGGPRVEIRTRPGGDRWRSNANVSLRDERLNARNAFASEEPSGQTRQYSWSANGPLVRNRTGLSFSVDGSEAFEQQAVRAALSGDQVVAALVDQPASRIGLSARLDHALDEAQTLSVEFRRGTNESLNQGIGEFDLPERAYTREGSNGRVRVSHRTTERAFVNSLRLQFAWDASEALPASQDQTIRVLDAHSSGGAQIQGGRRSQEFEIENELEFTIRNRHQMTAGLSVSRTAHRGDEWRNATGTFTFASLEMLEADRPTTFTQRLGDPSFEFSMRQLSWHLQDDYRVRRNLVVNVGVRHDVQTHLSDWANFSPRVGFNWTPFTGRRTTIRGSYGLFHRYFGASEYEQTLLVNGEQQRDLVIADPAFPDPFAGGVPQAERPPGIIRARSDIVMPSERQFLIGLNQPLRPWARLRATYTRRTGHNLFRSRDANAPEDGVRPNLAVRNITELESTARSLSHTLDLALSLSHEPRRLNANVSYRWRRARDESEGAFTLPPNSFDLSGEWGQSRQDIPHRLDLSVNTDLARGFRVNTSFRMQSGMPYTITTGFDTNGDGINNERPVGVERNSERGTATKNVDLTVTWGLGVGTRTASGNQQGGGGGQQGGRGGGPGRGGNRNSGGFRLEFYARATNVLNFVNPQRFSGVMASPFFGTATSAAAARRVVIGTRISL